MDQEEFVLAPKFREKLSKTICIEVPKDAFVAMDYHLDWVASSLVLFGNGAYEDGVFHNPGELIADQSYRLVQGTQEDIDLLVAFGPDSESIYHLVFLEAKAYGDGGFAIFDRSQLKSKGNRLLRIFGENRKTGQEYDNIKPYFYLVSKKKPDPLTSYDRPWSKDKWIELALPPLNERRIVERFDSERQKADRDGKYFRIRNLRDSWT